MWREIGEVFRTLGSDIDECRCILLVGEGKSFCSGIDIGDESFGFMDANDLNDANKNESDVARKYLSFRSKILEMQACLTSIEECPVPVVAAIHGACIGAGIDLSCCADVRLCSTTAKFSVREARLGLAADVGTLQRLPKICGHGSRIRELCLTGEDFDAKEALRVGFVSRVEEDVFGAAMEVCERIALNSPVAVQGTKFSLNYSRDHSVKEGLEHIAMHNSAALMTDDLMASVMASSTGTEGNFKHMMPQARL
jgi:delta(3,5)-delta(2,4)-dienoyl-CoA isomerase